MKEFMLFIRNEIDHQSEWKDQKHDQFLKACEVYIENLKRKGNLISAQPIEREGKMVSGSKEDWKSKPFNETKEVIVGYYHIRAKDLDEAISIAKMNPEFEFGKTARIEVRPVKMKEQTTDYVYPNEAMS